MFRQQNSKKCFGADVFCTFLLPNLIFWDPNLEKHFGADAFCTFSLPKFVFFFHSGVQLFVLLGPHASAPAALAGLLLD